MELIGNVSTAIPLHFDDVRNGLQNLLSTKRFVLKSINVSPAGDGLLGFLGDHSRVTVTYALDGKISKASLFAKSYPLDNKERAEFQDRHGMFEREIIVYTKILKNFIKYEDSKRWHPECLHISKHLFLFEDLNDKGYKMCNVKDIISDAHFFIALTSLARFHSSTIIHEEKHNDRNFRLQTLFENDLTPAVFGYNAWFKLGVETALKLAEVSEKYGKDTPHFATVNKHWNDVFKRGLELCGPSKRHRNVVTHADLWNNNLMYRYDENGEPVQCMLLDFQACRFAPPAADVVSFLYLHLDVETLNSKIDKFLIHYYNELTKNLSENGIDIKHILSWEDFVITSQEARIWGQVQSIVNLQLISLDERKLADAFKDSDLFHKLLNGNRSDGLLDLMKSNPVFRKRMMSLIHELIEMHILKR